MNKNKGWFIANIVVTTLGAIAGVASIFTGIKAAPFEKELVEREIGNNEKKDN